MAILSVSGYAKKRDCDEKAVRKAIESGKIKKGAIKQPNGSYKIDEDIANAEWIKNFNPDKYRSPKLLDGLGKAKREKDKAEANAISKELVKQKVILPANEEDEPIEDDQGLVEATRHYKILQVRELQISIAEKQKSLVRADLVYKQLFGLGQEIRAALDSFPDRVVDAVMAAESRTEGYKILKTEIIQIQSRLSKLDQGTIKL